MRLFFLLLSICTAASLTAQSSNFWSVTNEASIILNSQNDRGVIPDQYQTVSLELNALKTYLKDAPMHRTQEAIDQPLVLELPLPDGTLHAFNVVEAPVMEAALAAKFPQIKSFSGYSMVDKSIRVRFLYSTHGFRAFLYNSNNDRYYIQPYASGIQDTYIVFDEKHEPIPTNLELSCGVSNSDAFLHNDSPIEGMQLNGGGHSNQAGTRSVDALVELKEYKMAVAGVGEWVQNQGNGTVADGISSVNTVVVLLNSVLGPEAAINFVLVDGNEQLIYTDPNTDPYDNVTNGGGLLGQNQQNLDVVIGNANYDIGHVMTISCVGVGGIAGGTVCSSDGKGRGVTCNGGSLQNAILRTAVHEIAHQFSAAHTWDNCEGTIGNPPVDIVTQRASGTAFEPGSGSTIMSYAGGCQSQNVQFGSDEYYHVGSLQQIFNHSSFGGGSLCPDLVEVSNNLPELALPYENGFYIPISTPFELDAIASDLDADPLTYCWEQYNTGPLSDLGNPTGSAPCFRSYPPVSESFRIFPRLQSVVQNTQMDVEVLPDYTRNLKFRCTVRDNQDIGGVVWEEVSFEVTDEAGPFRVSYPNTTGLSLEVGQYTEIMWDVANTDVPPVNCQKVNLLLSIDGGYTYPFTLAENIPNNGAHFVTIPDAITSSGRVKVEAADNIFFDLSNFNFQIVGPSEPGFALDVTPFNQQTCAPDDVTIELNTLSLLGYDSLVTFTVTGLPAGANAVFSANPTPASEPTVLTIETGGITVDGFYPLEITAIASGGDTLVRNTSFEIVLNDFSAVVLVEPANGSSGIPELPTFSWTGSPNADTYDIEIATNPSFSPGSILEVATGVTATEYIPTLLLEKNTLYFWRIRPLNECGYGDYSVPQGFHTEVFECSNFTSTNVPLNISGVGTPTVESTLLINSEGTINDLNILKLKGSHDLVKHLDVSLKAPDGTEVELFSEICGVATVFNMGLDDEAPFDIQCPPTNGSTFKPQNSLSAFDGVEATGIWTLKLVVNNNEGVGGALEEWQLQLCSNASANAPFLVTNEVMPLPPGSGRNITNEFLLSDDADNEPSELKYTIVTAPENGTLFFLNTQELGVGSHFTQATINAGNLKYVHNGGPETTDGFTFSVEDGDGGWYGTPLFQIEIDPNVMVSTDDLEQANDFSIFPNPAQNELNLRFDNPVNDKLEVSITNVQGQVLQNQIFNNVNEQLSVSTNRLTNGIYFIYVRNENSTITKKFVIQK